MSTLSRGLTAPCGHTAPIHIVAGKLACARCDTRLVLDDEDAPAEPREGMRFNSATNLPREIRRLKHPRRVFREVCQRIKAAGGDARKEDRLTWSCAPVAWNTHRSPSDAEIVEAATETEDELADRDLAVAMLRPTRLRRSA